MTDSKIAKPAVSVPPVRIGECLSDRYVVIGELGAGTTGQVMAAFDRKLERRVAIKFLKRVTSVRARRRLRREAMAMAKLSHPNVVTVFDVSLHAERAFVVMEYVEGRTLGDEMREHSGRLRSDWSEVVKMFVSAARGLAAAHEAGFVHRDFKPDNVMIGTDGRVRVMDFGLVHLSALEELATLQGEDETEKGTQRQAEAALTGEGRRLGTPAYMAPEQFLADEISPRTDQFAFCVALYEALLGVPPFPRHDLEKLMVSVISGDLQPFPGRGIPTWLTQVLKRGLSRQPDDRFASMRNLIVTLERGEARRRRSAVALAATCVLGLGALGSGLVHHQQTTLIDRCERAGARVEVLWNSNVREALEQSMRATGVSYIETSLMTIIPLIDAQAAALATHETQACMETTVEHNWDEATSAKASWCLSDRRLELEGLLRTLTHANEGTVKNAVSLAATLTPIDSCSDPAALLSMGDAPPPTLRAQLTPLRNDLSDVVASLTAGAYDEALAGATTLERASVELGWMPMIITARLQRLKALYNVGKAPEAAVLGQALYVEAAGTGEWTTAASISISMIDVLGSLDRYAQARSWAENARMVLMHGADPLGAYEARRLRSLGEINQLTGDYDESLAQLDQALTILEQNFDPGHIGIADTHLTRGIVFVYLEQLERAELDFTKALSIYETGLGSTHPFVANALVDLGWVALSREDYDEALRYTQRASVIMGLNLGEDHPKYGQTLANLAKLYAIQGANEDAFSTYERALSILEKALGNEHSEVGLTYAMIGELQVEVGRLEQARATYEHALNILKNSPGPDHEITMRVQAKRDHLQDQLED